MKESFKNSPMNYRRSSVPAAFLFTVAILALGYAAFGIWTALIFTSGFMGGFLLWLLVHTTVPFAAIRVPFWIAFALFLLHRVEEKVYGFFDRLASITGTPVPEIDSVPVILLILLSVGAWLAVPALVKRGYAFGYYLAWTFFAAMGITELAHFALPLFEDQPYDYFPGMASVVVLAPCAWLGMYRLSRSNGPTF